MRYSYTCLIHCVFYVVVCLFSISEIYNYRFFINCTSFDCLFNSLCRSFFMYEMIRLFLIIIFICVFIPLMIDFSDYLCISQLLFCLIFLGYGNHIIVSLDFCVLFPDGSHKFIRIDPVRCARARLNTSIRCVRTIYAK